MSSLMDEVQVDDIEREFADVDISQNSKSPTNSSLKEGVGAAVGDAPPVAFSGQQNSGVGKEVLAGQLDGRAAGVGGEENNDKEEEEGLEEDEDEEEKVPTPTPPIVAQNNGFNVDEVPSSPHRRTSASNMKDILNEGNNDYYIEITISEPQKVGDGISSYLTYKVGTKTSIPTFKSHEFSTLRRFSDFLGIHELLTSKYVKMGRIVPPAPSKNLLGATKVKISPQQTEPGNGGGIQMEWVEQRRAALERFLNRVAQHPVLRTDTDFINFLESDQELPRAVNTGALSGAAVVRLFNKVGKTVNKITYKMDESDPWFDEKILEIENLDALFQKLHSALKSLVTTRKELANLTGMVAKSAAMLSSCEEHAGLSRALSSLADTEEKIEILRSEQSNSDFYIMAEFVKDYIGLFEAIKTVFHERVKSFQHWQNAQLQLTKRRENRGRYELTNRIDKLEQAQQEVIEWEMKVQRCQEQFEQISNEIKREMERFELNRVRDFKSNVVRYIEDQMAHQKQVFEKDDYRNARFVNAKRHVNENWAINLIAEVPPKECTSRVIYCDGGNGPLGHPKVYINLDKPGAHACGYCGLRFIKKDDHH